MSLRILRLVILGIAAHETRKIHRLVSSLSLGESVCFLEGLSEAELQWCYARCEAVVAPSLTEGFGLPVAEGLLAGCRIVCSDIPAHREVGDGLCRFVALGRDAEIALAKADCGGPQGSQGKACRSSSVFRSGSREAIHQPLSQAPDFSHSYGECPEPPLRSACRHRIGGLYEAKGSSVRDCPGR